MMRHFWISGVTVMLLSAGVFSQEADMERDLDRQHERLELEARQMGLEFERQMQELKLEERRAEIERLRQERHNGRGGLAALLAVALVVHLLLAIWVYQDVRQRNAAGGLWIVITLLSGCFGAVIYAIVRLGDIRKAES